MTFAAYRKQMPNNDNRSLKRALHPMPADIERALRVEGLAGDYDARPAYQRNDYIGWIERARRPETRRKRLEQMLDELRRGGVYMKMVHKPSMRSNTKARK